MKRLFALSIVAAFATCTSGPLRAANVPFLVDSNSSSLSISTAVSIFGSPLSVTPQGSGSLTAAYSGIVMADVTPTTIQLLPTTSLVAGISGNWQPGDDYSNYNPPSSPGSYPTDFAPANYGTVTDLTFVNGTISKSAIRNLKISLEDVAPKPLVAGVFEESGALTDFTSGTIYYSSGAAPPITDMSAFLLPGALTNAGLGTLSGSGFGAVLTIPVNFTVAYDISVLHIETTYSGTIVATAIPEPASAMLFAAASAVGALVVRRRRVR